MREELHVFLRDEEGLTTVEYAIAVMMITAAVALSFTFLGDTVDNVITTITGYLTGGKGTCCD